MLLQHGRTKDDTACEHIRTYLHTDVRIYVGNAHGREDVAFFRSMCSLYEEVVVARLVACAVLGEGEVDGHDGARVTEPGRGRMSVRKGWLVHDDVRSNNDPIRTYLRTYAHT